MGRYRAFNGGAAASAISVTGLGLGGTRAAATLKCQEYVFAQVTCQVAWPEPGLTHGRGTD